MTKDTNSVMFSFEFSLNVFSEFADKKYQISYSVADPGFPRGGGANPAGGVPTYDFAKIFLKAA